VHTAVWDLPMTVCADEGREMSMQERKRDTHTFLIGLDEFPWKSSVDEGASASFRNSNLLTILT
jgi:hypothetical protein